MFYKELKEKKRFHESFLNYEQAMRFQKLVAEEFPQALFLIDESKKKFVFLNKKANSFLGITPEDFSFFSNLIVSRKNIHLPGKSEDFISNIDYNTDRGDIGLDEFLSKSSQIKGMVYAYSKIHSKNSKKKWFRIKISQII